MGIILQRKDKTSIFCPQLNAPRNSSTIKTKFAGLVIAFSLMVIGTWIMMHVR